MLEAVMVAMIVLGAAYSVVSLRAAGETHDKPRASLEKLTSDSLTVLDGLSDANGTILDTAMSEQMHCALDPSPSNLTCASGRGANLSEKLQSYLPAGAAYAISLDNGIRARELYRSSQPAGESVAATYAYTPGWNFTFVLTELSCYDATMSVNATLLPVAHAKAASVTRVNASAGALSANATAIGGNRWNATLPAATRPASGTLVANASGRAGTYPGLTNYGSCDLEGNGAAIVAALRQDALLLPATAAVGAPATLGANLTHLAAVSGVTLVGSNITVYEPVPGRPGEADTWIPAVVLPLGASSVASATWTAPETSLFGAHPVALRAQLKVGVTLVEVRLTGLLPVALPNGVVPLDPPYRAVLRSWFSDWS